MKEVKEKLNDGLDSAAPVKYGTVAEGSDKWSSLSQSLSRKLPDHWELQDLIGKSGLLKGIEMVSRMRAILLWCQLEEWYEENTD